MTDENRLIDEIEDGKIVDALTERGTPPVNQAALDAAVADLNRDHFVAKVGGGAFVFREQDRPLLANGMSFTAFAQFRAPHRIGRHEVARKWLSSRNRRTYDNLVFDPSGQAQANVYNTWRGLAVEPRKGTRRLISEHIRDVWCSGDINQFNYVIQWMALLVQRPWIKPEVALVLHSGEGTGKNIIVRVLSAIFGEHAFITSQKEQVAGRFNGHLFDKLLVVLDEALFAGDPAAVAAAKALVTNAEIGYESKGKAAFTAPNYAHVIIVTNNEWAVSAGGNSRRWMVLDVCEARKGDHAYFKNLAAEIENGGVAAFLYSLLRIDLSGFNPRQLPISKALAAQRAQTMERINPVGAFLMHTLAAGEFRTQHVPVPWRKEISAGELQDSYTIATARCRNAPPGFDLAMRRLRSFLPPGSLKKIRKRQGGCRPFYYLLPALKVAREHFQHVTGIDPCAP